jgi:molybdopterin synthase catalytic subunit
MIVRLQEADFDVAAEAAALVGGRTDIGAVVTFTGLCRGTPAPDPIAAITLEHYPGMAETEISRLVATAAAHRHDAFAAAEFIMDFLKTRAPIWKREERPGGARWVEAKHTDDVAADRWDAPEEPKAAE